MRTSTIRNTFNAMRHGDLWPTILVPAFPWGDHSVLTTALGSPPDKTVFLDPSGMVPHHPAIRLEKRKRAWVLASLFDHSGYTEKLNLGWDVEYYGHKGSDQPRVQEHELMQVYVDNWGIISPPYRHAAGGWWRNRFVYATHAVALLHGDLMEVAGLGNAYTAVSIDPRIYELMGKVDLRAAAELQREVFLSKSWRRERFLDEFSAIRVSSVRPNTNGG